MPDVKRLIWLLPFVLMVLMPCGCSDDPTEPNEDDPLPDPTKADSVATYWMRALSDSLEQMPDDRDSDFYEGIRYEDVRGGMDDAFEFDSSSRIAHLGSALLDIIEINYDPEIWEMVDSIRTYADEDKSGRTGGGLATGGIYFRPGSPILRNQFALLATAPRELARRTLKGIPSNLTLARAQEIMEDVLLPAFVSALDHLEAAERDGGPRIEIVLEDETIEIDLGEILLFDASLHAARAGLRIATAYDVDLFGPDGTYRWIDEIRDLDLPHTRFGYVEEEGPTTTLFDESWDLEDAAEESIGVEILKYNLESRPGFLSKRNDRMNDAYDDLLALRDKLAETVSVIRSEGDDQEDDVVRIADLVDLDRDIEEGGDKPRFAEDFTTVEDVLDWVRTVMTGTYRVSEEGDYGEIEIDVNLSSFFRNAPENWKEFLPFYRFKPPEDWVTWELHWEYWWPVDPEVVQCYIGYDHVEYCRDGIDQITRRHYSHQIEPLELLDAAGGDPIDLEDAEIPYFEDYTFGGLFPDATRQSWLDLFQAAGW